jgi:hypothetical protein
MVFVMDDLGGLSRSQAIKKLFGLKLTEYPKFKDKLAALEANGALKINKTAPMGGEGSRSKRYYLPEHLAALHNVVLISAIYPKPQVILNIVEDADYRRKCAGEIEDLLAERTEVGQIEIETAKLDEFLAYLKSGLSLTDSKIVNPFKTLPQTIPHKVDGYLSVLAAYHLPEVVSSNFERMMAYFFDLEIVEAYELSLRLTDATKNRKKYIDLIQSTYRESKEFEEVLESFF